LFLPAFEDPSGSLACRIKCRTAAGVGLDMVSAWLLQFTSTWSPIINYLATTAAHVVLAIKACDQKKPATSLASSGTLNNPLALSSCALVRLHSIWLTVLCVCAHGPYTD